MEEHFLRECKLQSSWWYSICLNYLSPADCNIWQCYPPLCLSLSLVTLLKSWILLTPEVSWCLLMSPDVSWSQYLLVRAGGRQWRPGPDTSLLSSHCRPTESLCRTAWSLETTDELSVCPVQSQHLENTKHFPPVSSRLPTPGYANCIQKKPPRDPTLILTEWGFNFTFTGAVY